MRSEWVLVGIAALAVLAYITTLFVLPALQGGERTYDVDGLRIIAKEPPREALKRLFAEPDLRLRLDLYEGTDDRNRAIAAMGAEIAAAFAGMDRELSVYGMLSGKPEGCNEQNGNCTGARLIVRYGSCNCVRITEEMVVEGDAAFLKDNVVKMRGIIRLVLADLGPPAATPPSGPLSDLVPAVNRSA